ncbi:MAG: hypothetical protein F4109_04280 [Gammaproteobacteria bacterium]|nr:hypothetical protein [Gammaproteobacteria bacterium]MYI24632.1 hypothetical protein [Gammaproteobacteria bacterium]
MGSGMIGNGQSAGRSGSQLWALLWALTMSVASLQAGWAQQPVRAYLMTSTAASPLGPSVELHIINTSDYELRFTGTLYNTQGARLGESGKALSDLPVNAKGRLVLTSSELEERFGVGAWVQPAMLEIMSDIDGAPFVAMVKLRSSPGAAPTNVNCVAEGAVHNIAGMDQPDRTFVRFINTGFDAISDVRGTLRDAGGNIIGLANSALLPSLGPKEHIWVSGQELATRVGGAWQGQASLYLSPHFGLELMNMNLSATGAFDNFSCHEKARDGNRFVSEASYTVTFTARWTSEIHDSVPASSHFTTLVGAATNGRANLWMPGELASAGLENVAELGQTGQFLNEIGEAMSNMTAASPVISGGTGSTGTSVFELNLSRAMPLFTFASMVAPSPDWFVGLSEFPLLDKHGGWVGDTGHMNLAVWDAGTETGNRFSLSGTATNPHQPIRQLTAQIGDADIVNGVVNGKYLATIRFQRNP